MAKIISYKIQSGEERLNVETECETQAQFDVKYPIAEKEAIPGTIKASGEFDPEPEIPENGDVVTWTELNTAYEAGYSEGYTEGVNSAYD